MKVVNSLRPINEITNKQKSLEITVNNNTRNEYPLIVEVVCENCWNILNRSHKNTKLVNETGEYFVNYCCDIQNSHQRKEVEFKFKICDGILALCKRK